MSATRKTDMINRYLQQLISYKTLCEVALELNIHMLSHVKYMFFLKEQELQKDFVREDGPEF